MVAERCTRDSLCLSEAVLGARTQAPVEQNTSSRHVGDKSCWFLELLTLRLCEGSGLHLLCVVSIKRGG